MHQKIQKLQARFYLVDDPVTRYILILELVLTMLRHEVLLAKMYTTVKKRKQTGRDSVLSSIWLLLIFPVLQRCCPYRFVVVVVVVVVVVIIVAVVII